MTQRRSRRSSIGGLYSRGVVRTRGYIPVIPSEERHGEAVRTRGAVHTRREPAVQIKPWQEQCEELKRLLEELRDAQDRFPITIVVENVQAPEAQSFLECLHKRNLLGADDVLWVLGEGAYKDAVPKALHEFVPESAYLNTQEGEQKALADTLVPDLVFVADRELEKLKEWSRKWERRVWAAILAGPDKLTSSDPKDLNLGLPDEKGNPWCRFWR